MDHDSHQQVLTRRAGSTVSPFSPPPGEALFPPLLFPPPSSSFSPPILLPLFFPVLPSPPMPRSGLWPQKTLLLRYGLKRKQFVSLIYHIYLDHWHSKTTTADKYVSLQLGTLSTSSPPPPRSPIGGFRDGLCRPSWQMSWSPWTRSSVISTVHHGLSFSQETLVTLIHFRTM